MPGFNWFDACLIGVMGISGLVGLMRGLIREVFSLAVWGLGIWVGLRYSEAASIHLQDMISLPSVRTGVAFAILFLLTLMLAGLVGALLARMIASVGLSGIDRLAGLSFGIARGALMIAVLVFLGRETPFPRDPWWRESRLIPTFQSLAIWLAHQVPPGYVRRLGAQIVSDQ